MERNLQIASSPNSAHHVHFPKPLALLRISSLLAAYTAAITSLLTLYKEYLQMAAEIDALSTEVTETVGIINSAVTLINGIGARIQAAVDAALAANPGVDLSALTTLTTELDTASTALATAVAANP